MMIKMEMVQEGKQTNKGTVIRVIRVSWPKCCSKENNNIMNDWERVRILCTYLWGDERERELHLLYLEVHRQWLTVKNQETTLGR